MRIDVHEHNLARALIKSKRLSPDQALRRRLVERELQRVIGDFIDRFVPSSEHEHLKIFGVQNGSEGR